MQDFQSRNRLRKKIYSVPIVILALALSFVFIRGAWKVLGKERLSAENLAKSEKELLQAKEREGELQERITEIESPSGVEREVREKFNVRREGEEVVLVVESKEKKEEDGTRSRWKRVKEWFVNLFDSQ